MASPENGLILHLQRLSTEDGPGLRTTVFFKGCPLRCAWCHNPEGLSSRPQTQWLEDRCIGCDTCLTACPDGCLAQTEAGVVIDRDHCKGCGACAEACPANALQRLGIQANVDELLRELLKDRAYYAASGGGVTLSGGEPSMQAGFASALLQRLQEAGIHTALDTCGLCSLETFEKLLPYVDLVLFDLKEIDPEKHHRYTGQSNELILRNLKYVNARLGQRGGGLWVRTPLIPGATASFENLAGLGAWLAHHLDGVLQRWELCTFNNLCREKYRRLDLPWAYSDLPLLTRSELEAFEQCARRSGVDPALVIATGAARLES